MTSAANDRPRSPDEESNGTVKHPGPTAGPKVVALGGGHGLYASLSALRRVTDRLTAIVTVADDGGSSGRLRRELGVLPPGDLRMALAALCGDDEWGQTWRDVVQHRFRSEGDLKDHAVGNLLIVALWELLGGADADGSTVAGLDWVGRLLGAHGRVLPMAAVPMDIVAEVRGADPSRPDEITHVKGQAACAKTPGSVLGVSLVPADPPACQEALDAVEDADWILFGPGSWFTSVLPHLKVPALARALTTARARRAVALNLAPQPGETDDFSPQTHLEVLQAHAPDLRVDVVIADRAVVDDPAALEKAAQALGGRLVLADVAADDGSPRHEPARLAQALVQIFSE
ncbi:uridine diphosphate-N-acetylglucosamine-binding protein YvcK [Actinomadura bangladeshensis]|uniref:Putative gluconeogenesis factor n=1 Tax=Actinomadura bangladeshensis TaxID=453573 RepID=A0A6L9QUV5_9ACTN|nr:uridine diphosphate-N-acetylglucosamine-binding protein YvcK [Actinomadura bangladeshensis]